jgi:hypothetical protein
MVSILYTNWSEELFTVVKCIETSPSVYLVKDDHGKILEGTFYAEELQKFIMTDDVYKIETILNLHDCLGPFLPYSLLDTVVWLAHVTSAGGMPILRCSVRLYDATISGKMST